MIKEYDIFDLDRKFVEPLCPPGYKLVKKIPADGERYFTTTDGWLQAGDNEDTEYPTLVEDTEYPTLVKVDPLELEGQELVDYLNEISEDIGERYVPEGWSYEKYKHEYCRDPSIAFTPGGMWEQFKAGSNLHGVLRKPTTSKQLSLEGCTIEKVETVDGKTVITLSEEDEK